MRFEINKSARRGATDLSSLRLYLNANLPTAFAMHLAFTRQADSVAWRRPQAHHGSAANDARPLDSVRFEAAGFSTQERLWPKADAALSGYQLVLEYFTFREKFLFVDRER